MTISWMFEFELFKRVVQSQQLLVVFRACQNVLRQIDPLELAAMTHSTALPLKTRVSRSQSRGGDRGGPAPI